ncbi:hypothetical protein MNB_ARC-1_631 [hydrothermal vent metagenome]|uniref:Outer membrane protein beta-barrel domain-containing protein n=1 Tax=hydrothermal vent metagenome TaxID=652676 RepID=A0A3B1E4R8_9ZZZZ
MKKIILSMVLISGMLYANGSKGEINVNSDTLELEGDFYLNNTYNLSNYANYYGIINYLSSETNTANSTLTKRLVAVGFKILNPFSNEYGFSLGLGLKAVISNDRHDKTNTSFLSIPLSIYGKYDFNEVIYVNGSYSYAPKTLSLLDAKGYKDIKLAVNYRVLENGYVFIGIRDIETIYDLSVSVKYDNSLFFGYKIHF